MPPATKRTTVNQPSAKHPAMDEFAALDTRKVALLLDVDGTLIDIAPSPFEVNVPEELCRALDRLLMATGGALALVSGRPIGDLDKLFSPLKLPAIGGHGAETRLREGEVISGAKPLPPALRRLLAEAATPGSGVVVEDKGYSFALHFRGAPQQELRLKERIAAGRAAFPGEEMEVLPGKAMFEVKRPGVSKGEAVRVLMQRTPFAGRIPVFIGDDVTDESVFAILPALGGKGFSVGRSFAGVTRIFASPDEVREALRKLAAKARSRGP
jgi:trehalose 6-phosphate phosphatase